MKHSPCRARVLVLCALLLLRAGTAAGGDLLDAVRDGDLKLAMALARGGAPVAETGALGDTPLHWAAFNGQVALARLLIARGAPVNARVNLGSTPLHLAAYAGHLDMVKLLVGAGADLHARNAEGLSAVQWAARNGHLKVVNALVDHGATAPGRRQMQALARPGAAGGIRGMSRQLGDLPSLVMRVPEPPPPGAVKLTPHRELDDRPAPVPAAARQDGGAADDGSAWLQLGAFKERAMALSHWQQLRGELREEITGFEPMITTVQLENRGEYHRLRIGPLERHQAERLCARIHAGKGDCLVLGRERR